MSPQNYGIDYNQALAARSQEAAGEAFEEEPTA